VNRQVRSESWMYRELRETYIGNSAEFANNVAIRINDFFLETKPETATRLGSVPYIPCI